MPHGIASGSHGCCGAGFAPASRSSETMEQTLPLDGRTIGITAERRADEQAKLLISRGASVLRGPTLRISSVLDDASLRNATEAVIARPPDYLLASTCYGGRTCTPSAGGW